jgi:exonuclease 3'-5' domain-containing protein 1
VPRYEGGGVDYKFCVRGLGLRQRTSRPRALHYPFPRCTGSYYARPPCLSCSPHFINTHIALSDLVDTVIDLPTNPPSLYIDLEGVELSRHGTISILQLFASTLNCAYLIDIHTLRDEAFSTAGTKGHNLKWILESEAIPKVFFAVRNDSDALFHHFQISLAGIQDLQLMELATRTFSRRCVNGLSRCIERDAPMTTAEKLAWKAAKEKGLNLFAPERGGSYGVFNTRPLPEEIKVYCVQDVHLLPKLWSYYDRKMTMRWAERVNEASKDRVALSQGKYYNGKGRHMAMAPVGWA